MNISSIKDLLNCKWTLFYNLSYNHRTMTYEISMEWCKNERQYSIIHFHLYALFYDLAFQASTRFFTKNAMQVVKQLETAIQQFKGRSFRKRQFMLCLEIRDLLYSQDNLQRLNTCFGGKPASQNLNLGVNIFPTSRIPNF